MTKREAIIAAVTTALDTIPNLTVQRSRTNPFAIGRLPCVTVSPIVDTPDNAMTNVTDWVLGLRVAVHVAGDVPDQIADPIIEAVHEKIMEDVTFLGLAMDTKPEQVGYDFSDGEQSFCIVSMNYSIQYRTNTDSLN